MNAQKNSDHDKAEVKKTDSSADAKAAPNAEAKDTASKTGSEAGKAKTAAEPKDRPSAEKKAGSAKSGTANAQTAKAEATKSEAAKPAAASGNPKDGDAKGAKDQKPGAVSQDPPPVRSAPAPASSPPAASSGQSGLGWAALIVAVVGSVGAATISSWGPGTIGYPPSPNNGDQLTALDTRLGELSARIETLGAETLPTLETRLADLEARPAGNPDGLAAAETRISDLEGRPAGDPDGMADLAGRLETLSDDVSAQTDNTAQLSEQSDRLDGLSERIGGLEGGLANIEGRLSSLQSGLDAVDGRLGETAQALTSIDSGLKSNASAMLSVDGVRAAIDQGRPYADQMPQLAALAEGTPELGTAVETLTAYADGGLAPYQDLSQRFPATARAVRDSLRAPDDQSLLSRTLAQVTGLVDVRPTGDAGSEGQDAAQDGASEILAALSSAEGALATDDLAGAVESLGALSGPAAEAAAPWVTDATALLTANRALDQLRQAALVRLGQGAG